MASAPLNWLLKIGGATLKTTAKTLSEAVNTLHDTVTNLSATVTNLGTSKADASTTTTALNNLETSKLNVSDLLSLEEIEASTSLTGKGVTAESIKSLNNSLGGVQFGIDGEGNRCYLGADGSLIPFNRVSTGSFTISSSGSTVQLGFKPKTVFVFNFSSSGQPLKMAYHSDDTPLNGFYNATSQGGYITNEQAITPIDNGFTMKQFSDWITGTCYYYAW